MIAASVGANICMWKALNECWTWSNTVRSGVAIGTQQVLSDVAWNLFVQ